MNTRIQRLKIILSTVSYTQNWTLDLINWREGRIYRFALINFYRFFFLLFTLSLVFRMIQKNEILIAWILFQKKKY